MAEGCWEADPNNPVSILPNLLPGYGRFKAGRPQAFWGLREFI